MGLLDGGIAGTFAGAFGALYLEGSLYRLVAWSDDGMGGGEGGGFADAESVKVQLDQATQAMRASEGFVEGDVRILLLAQGVATPDTDCEITAGGTRYMVETVSTDCAGSYYELRGRRKTNG